MTDLGSLSLSPSRVLVLAPHTDDGELGAGATISRLSREGHTVHYVAFSACETIQPIEPIDILRTECERATARLGIDQSRLEILHFEVRQFHRDRQLILEKLVSLSSELRPDLVLLPSTDDTHQDHHVVSDEARRAFKRTRMLGYEVPWNNFRFESTAFVPVGEDDVAAKVAAVTEFASQTGRPYMDPRYLEAQLRFHGVQAGTEFAEAFQVLRWYL